MFRLVFLVVHLAVMPLQQRLVWQRSLQLVVLMCRLHCVLLLPCSSACVRMRECLIHLRSLHSGCIMVVTSWHGFVQMICTCTCLGCSLAMSYADKPVVGWGLCCAAAGGGCFAKLQQSSMQVRQSVLCALAGCGAQDVQ